MNQKDKTNKQQKVQLQQKKQNLKNNQNLWIWVVLSVVFITTFVIYVKALKFDFLHSWDDNLYITENSHIKDLHWANIKLFFTKFYVSNYQPITMLMYAIEYKIGAGKFSIFHFNNILLHIFNTYLVFVLVRKISPKSVVVAMITATFFAVHPMHVESVAWVAERKDVLYSFFFLLSLIIYINYLKSGKAKYLIYVSVFFVLSCMSKSAAVITPLIMLLFDYYTNRKYKWKMIIEKIPFFTISLIFGFVAIHSQKEAIQYTAINMSIFEHISIVSYSFISYLFKAFIPVNLSAIYAYPIELGSTLPIMYYFSILCVVLMLFLVWYSKRWGKDVIFGFLFFIITIILVLQFVPVGNATMADRYSYIPFIGVFFVIGKIYEQLSMQLNANYKRYLFLAPIFGFIAFSILTYSRVKIWENDDTLFSDVINKYPNCNVSYRNRGSYYLNYYAGKVYINDNFKREIYLKKAILDLENSLKFPLTPDMKGKVYNQLGLAKSDLGDIDGAIQDYSKSIEIDSSSIITYLNRGTSYMNYYANKLPVNNIKREMYLKKAIIDFEKTLRFSLPSTDKIRVYQNLGIVKSDLGDFDGAILDYNKSIEIDSLCSSSYLNRGNCYMNYSSNKTTSNNIKRDMYLKKAINDFENTLKFSLINIEKLKAYYNLGTAKFDLGDFMGAINDFDKAIKIDTNYAIAYYNRANTKYQLKNYKGAIEDYNKAIELNSKDANSIKNRNIVISILATTKK